MAVGQIVAQQSVFRGTLDFFAQLGVYDVVLPFLLVFTLIFAILEKTKIFGTEKFDGKEITRKNLNGMTAFVIAFFVVASTQLVMAMNYILGYVTLLLLFSICFLLLAGSFHTGKEEFALQKGWKTMFMIIMFIGVIIVFLAALPDPQNSWLNYLWFNLTMNFNSVVVSSLVLIIIIIVFMLYVTGSFDKKKGSDSKSE
jgi:lysylphosphatidylglycerol synthetase-like protein (DUF2156 family)